MHYILSLLLILVPCSIPLLGSDSGESFNPNLMAVCVELRPPEGMNQKPFPFHFAVERVNGKLAITPQELLKRMDKEVDPYLIANKNVPLTPRLQDKLPNKYNMLKLFRAAKENGIRFHCLCTPDLGLCHQMELVKEVNGELILQAFVCEPENSPAILSVDAELKQSAAAESTLTEQLIPAQEEATPKKSSFNFDTVERPTTRCCTRALAKLKALLT